MKRRVPRARVGHDRWLVSYADFITLLFGFFVVLFAFSKADQRKQTQVVASIDAAFRSMGVSTETARAASNRHVGAGIDTPPTAQEMAENLVPPARVQADLDLTRRKLEQNLSGQLAAHTVSIHMGRDGLVISLREAGFFASGSATPSAATLATLRQVAASLEGTPYDLRIEGHTDSLPIHSAEFDSNWELSTTRATSIARLMLDLKALPPDQISAAGYAGFHPVASNETEEGRAENRRVDLVLVPRTHFHFPDSGSTQAAGSPWRRITDN